MRVAVTYENGEVYQHFGHTEQFKIYVTEEKEILSSEIVDTNGSGHGALAGMLSGQKVDTLICGGIGQGAKDALAQAGISLYGGVTGGADAAVKAFWKETFLIIRMWPAAIMNMSTTAIVVMATGNAVTVTAESDMD